MMIKLVALVLLCLMTGTAVAQEPKVTSLMSKDLPENPGREALMITVEHAPGGSSAIHRHNALPGMKIATVAASPVVGGKLVSVDDSKARAIKGVRQIVRCGGLLADGVKERLRRQHQAAGMKSRPKIGKTFHNVHSANGACDHRPPRID